MSSLGGTNTATDLASTVESIQRLFRTVNPGRQYDRPLAVARQAFDQWMDSAREASTSPNTVQTLREIYNQLQRLESSSDKSAAIESIKAGVESLSKTSASPAVNTAPPKPVQSNLHKFQNNTLEGEARGAYGNQYGTGYTGPISTQGHNFDGNKASDRARAQYGDVYNGKSVFDD